MSARERSPRRLYVETAYKQDETLHRAVDEVRKKLWGDQRAPVTYMSNYEYLLSSELLLSKLFIHLDSKYSKLFTDDELCNLIKYGEVWAYEVGFSVQKMEYGGYTIQVGADISLREFKDIWLRYIKPYQIPSRNRGPAGYKIVYAVKRAEVFGCTPKEIAEMLTNGKLECFEGSKTTTAKEVTDLILKASKSQLI